MFILDNKPLPLDTPFEHDGIQYPTNWLRLATPEERAAIGITEVVDQTRPDDRFYWVGGPNPDGSHTATPKDLDDLKKIWADQFRQTAYTMLLPSDWMVVRKQEDGSSIPQAWTDYRSNVRLACTAAIADMTVAKDIDSFINVVTSVKWPSSPDQQSLNVIKGE